jgi:threonine dehydrogenase-like Zn-dependent dehydrogenase
VAIVGSGPIGLAALLTAQFYSRWEIIMVDLDDDRLGVAKRFGATATVISADGDAETGDGPDARSWGGHRHRSGRHPGHVQDLAGRRAAYDTFGNAAAETKALKVIVKA